MNLYDIRTFIDNASDADVAMLLLYITAENNRRDAGKALANVTHDFLRYMEQSKDYDKMAYDMVKDGIDYNTVDVHLNSATIAGISDINDKVKKLVDYCYSSFFLRRVGEPFPLIALVKKYRQMSGKGLAESKHHIEKATRQCIADYIRNKS